MTGRDPSAVVRDVQTLFGGGAVGGLTDGQLLERFVTRRDAVAEAAFTALVQRHGPMVWGVCRRILNDPHAAADAFQATFLVLVRKAPVVRVDDSLGRWLYGVSRKVARRARINMDKRSARETRGVETLVGPVSVPDPDRSELLAQLDEEIGRLPGRYQAVVVLCDLGDMTHEQAAQRLGCAVGTVGSRLARGRERLRDRLTRRGLVPSATVLGALLSVKTASAAVPTALVDSTARAALRIVSGEAALVTASVSALSKGTLNAMLWPKLKAVAALASLVGAGLLVFSYRVASEAKAPPAASKEEAPAVRAAEPPEESVPQTLARMAETYAVAHSYEDEGEVVTVFTDEDGRRRTERRPFSTKFVRPKLFRYEFSQRDGDGDGERNRYVIWGNAGPTRCKEWWTLRPKIKEASLTSAIGECNGISGGSSLTIPEFLLGAGSGRPFTGMHDFQRAGEEVVDSALCEKIEGKNIENEPETVWIDKASFLLKKIFHKSQVPGSAVETTTTYRPRLNVEIAPEQFTFVPPTLPKVVREDPPTAPPRVVPRQRPRPAQLLAPPPVPAPAAASSDTEQRLAAVERKLERILGILESESQARRHPRFPPIQTSPDNPTGPHADSTASAALRFADGEAALITANVSPQSKGTLNAMLRTRLKVVAALASLASAGLIVCSCGRAAESKAPPVASQEDAPARGAAESAGQILARMAETYAVAHSYEDEGEVVTVFINQDGRRRTVKKLFATKFVRPKLFRFEYSNRAGEGEDERDRYVIWSNAGPTRSRTWWTLEPEIREDSLASSLQTAAGVSSRSSNTVPPLLMPGLGPGSRFSRLQDIKRVDEEAVDEAPCDKIEAKSSTGNPVTLWIDKATFLVKKILEKSQVPGSAVETTITYRPRLDVEIALEEFTFVPPALPHVARGPQLAAPPVPAPAAASSDMERRLTEVERKLERILRILEGEGRTRLAPAIPANPTKPRSPAPAQPPGPPAAPAPPAR